MRRDVITGTGNNGNGPDTTATERRTMKKEQHTMTDADVIRVHEIMEEAARYLLTPLQWWQMGAAWNRRRHELVAELRTKAMDLRLQT